MSVLRHTPQFTNQEAANIALKFYGIQSDVAQLPSERDQNFLLQGDQGKLVLKISNAADERSLLEAQNQALIHLSKYTNLSPQIVRSQSNESAVWIQQDERRYLVRMVHYIEGIPLGNVRRSPLLMKNLGKAIGIIDRSLSMFDHPALHRDFYWDLANGLRIVEEHQSNIDDSEMRDLVFQLGMDFKNNTLDLLSEVRKSIIHNDANDYNVLLGGNSDPFKRHQHIVGIIDYGDMVYSYTVADLAVTIAYAILNQPDPLKVASQVIEGYQTEYPLTEVEIASLFGLICLRLCMSVCIAANQQKERPNDPYLAISQQGIRNTLPLLSKIHPGFAEAQFRHACGMSAVKIGSTVSKWLHEKRHTFASVLEIDLRTEPFVVIDLTPGSALLSGNEEENAEPLLTERVRAEMKAANAAIGVGRYAEPRFLYTSSAFAATDAYAERRTVHLGIDLFSDAGSAVYAPIAGEVRAFCNNAAFQDYGPVIILKHTTDDGNEFYTLYGHLSVESLQGLFVGKKISAGERLATLGTPDVNGGWTPHLHFQIILDLLDMECDFPGVCRPGERLIWFDFSPDPNLILNLPPNRLTERSESTLEKRQQVIGPNVRLSYRDPVKIVRGWMQYLYDEDGRKYLDAYNNVPHVGHCHPRVVQAAERQMRILNTNSRYLHDAINLYAERLCSTLPVPLRVCFFVNSGSEANELALRLARAHTKQKDFVVLEAAYHGNTTTLIDISPYKHNGPGGEGTPDWVHIAPLADPYRGDFKHSDPRAGEKYAGAVSDVLKKVQTQGKGISGFIAESCPSVGGQILFPPEYLKHVYELIRNAGGVCIADEVQTGYGRMGTHFWGFETQNVVPDIVVLGKPIGNGHPIGAVVTTPEIAASFNNGMEYFSTFGGNTVSCEVGLAVLNVVIEEHLQEHALEVGNYLLHGLNTLLEKYSVVGDVRGSGLFLGVELVRDRGTLEPATQEASYVANRMRELRVLLGTDGPFHNVLKIRPPMPFNQADADHLIKTLDLVLSEL